MIIPFHPVKVAQAAATLIRLEQHHRISRLRLLKLLYIADRDLLESRSRPMTGDRPVAMENGPVLSSTYNLIKGVHDATPLWARFFRNEGRDVVLIQDPGVSELTQLEIKKLQELSEKFADWDDWAVAEFTHQYQEWQRNKPPERSSKPIPIDDLLDAVGLSDRKAELLANEKAELAMERILA